MTVHLTGRLTARETSGRLLIAWFAFRSGSMRDCLSSCIPNARQLSGTSAWCKIDLTSSIRQINISVDWVYLRSNINSCGPSAKHYSRETAFRQKIAALSGRTVTQSRDIFDLKLPFDAGAGQQKLPPALAREVPKATGRGFVLPPFLEGQPGANREGLGLRLGFPIGARDFSDDPLAETVELRKHALGIRRGCTAK